MGKATSGPGSSGKASNAALQDDEDVMNRMARRGRVFREWASKRKKGKLHGSASAFDYPNSPKPMMKKA